MLKLIFVALTSDSNIPQVLTRRLPLVNNNKTFRMCSFYTHIVASQYLSLYMKQSVSCIAGMTQYKLCSSTNEYMNCCEESDLVEMVTTSVESSTIGLISALKMSASIGIQRCANNVARFLIILKILNIIIQFVLLGKLYNLACI